MKVNLYTGHGANYCNKVVEVIKNNFNTLYGLETVSIDNRIFLLSETKIREKVTNRVTDYIKMKFDIINIIGNSNITLQTLRLLHIQGIIELTCYHYTYNDVNEVNFDENGEYIYGGMPVDFFCEEELLYSEIFRTNREKKQKNT